MSAGAADAPMSTAGRLLIGALLVLAGVYVAWFGHARTSVVALVVFAVPPLALAFARWRGARTAGFWAAVIALLWFSHGVMVAWTRPGEASFAWAELLLSVVVVLAASWTGLRMRFARKR